MAAKKKASEQAAPPPEAPGAEATPASASTPNRRNRHTFYPDGLDYVLVQVQCDDQGEPVPNGALTAVPGQRDGPPTGETDANGKAILSKIPLRFESAQEGERWLRAAGEQCAGQLIICVRMMWRMRVLVQQKPVITVTKEERFLKPPKAEAQPAATG